MYDYNYTETDNFRNSRIIINHVLLKNNLNCLADDIDRYVDTIPNLIAINLSILNENTLEDNRSNKYTRWIRDKAVLKKDWNDVFEYLNSKYFLIKDFEERSEKYRFDHTVPLYFYPRRGAYGNDDIVIYKGGITNYKLSGTPLVGI